MISEERLSQALRYLAETDEQHAKAKAHMKGMEQQLKTIRAICYLRATGTQGERAEKAYSDQEYRDAVEQYENLVADYEILNNKRNTETLVIDVWRSLNSARTKGVI